jgi:hypothetical protein
MEINRLRKLISEVLSTPPKQDSCNCGCHSCENVGNPGVVLNESLSNGILMTENLQYHVQNKLPLTENTFRYGSDSFLDLWSEARYLYVREIIHVNEDDKHILEETNLGEYGIYEGKKVPLDLPMLEENEVGDEEDTEQAQGTMLLPYADLIDKLSDLYYSSTNPKLKQIYSDVHDELVDAAMNRDKEKIDQIFKKYGKFLPTNLNEEEKQPALNKPKRGGSKKFYVYVKNPKTKKIKKVSFGDTTGLSAKINNPEARRAFAKRHKCGTGEPKTSPKWWSCRLPKFAKLLGLKGSFSGFW